MKLEHKIKSMGVGTFMETFFMNESEILEYLKNYKFDGQLYSPASIKTKMNEIRNIRKNELQQEVLTIIAFKKPTTLIDNHIKLAIDILKEEYKIENINISENANKIVDENNPLIVSLRNKFRNNLIKEFEDYKKAIGIVNEYKQTYIKDQEIAVRDCAHIISVQKLIEEERIDEISNIENGMILDPNTHRLFDNNIDTYLKDNIIFTPTYKVELDPILMKRKTKYINEYLEQRG